MAEIDKALPNEVRKEINIPSIEDIQVELEQPVEEVIETSDEESLFEEQPVEEPVVEEQLVEETPVEEPAVEEPVVYFSRGYIDMGGGNIISGYRY